MRGGVLERDGDELVASLTRNAVTPRLPRQSIDEATVIVEDLRLPTSAGYASVFESRTWFPIDIVYTWVDDANPLAVACATCPLPAPSTNRRS